MGVQILPTCSMEPEMKPRAANMYDKLFPMRRAVFKNTDAPIATRVALASSLMHTRLFYNSCTIHEMRKLQKAYLSPYRTMYCMVNDTVGIRHTDIQVYTAADALPMGVALRIQRLKYFARLLSAGPSVLLHLVLLQHRSQNSWFTLVKQDLDIAWKSSDNLFTTMPSPHIGISDWMRCIAEFPGTWSSTFKRIFTSSAFKAQLCTDLLGLMGNSVARQGALTVF